MQKRAIWIRLWCGCVECSSYFAVFHEISMKCMGTIGMPFVLHIIACNCAHTSTKIVAPEWDWIATHTLKRASWANGELVWWAQATSAIEIDFEISISFIHSESKMSKSVLIIPSAENKLYFLKQHCSIRIQIHNAHNTHEWYFFEDGLPSPYKCLSEFFISFFSFFGSLLLLYVVGECELWVVSVKGERERKEKTHTSILPVFFVCHAVNAKYTQTGTDGR